MRVNEVKSFLDRLYRSQQGRRRTSVLLLGGPGIGKSTCVREFAEATARRLGKEFIDYDDTCADKILADPRRYFVFHNLPLVGCEPSDLTGQPRVVDGSVRYLPLAWARVMSSCDGCLFLDDFLDTQRMDVMSAAYRIFLERRIGYVYMNPGVQVVAASNTPEYSTLSQMMPLPLANRCIIINVSPPTPLEWANWMDSKYGEWDRRVFAFLKRFEDSGYIFKPPKEAETLEQYPTPRSWSELASLLTKGIEGPETLAGLVGEEMGQKFRAFCELSIDIDELASTPSKFRGLSLDSKYLAVIELATAVTGKNFSKFLPLLDEIAADSREWLVILVISLPLQKRNNLLQSLVRVRPDLVRVLENVVYDRERVTR